MKKERDAKHNVVNLSGKLLLVVMLMILSLGIFATPSTSYAKEVCTRVEDLDESNGNISYDPKRYVDAEEFKIQSSTIVSDIVVKIKDRLILASQKMYMVVVLNTQYIMAIQTVILLFVVVYGVLFTTGMVQAKLNDIVMRMLKLGVVVMITTPDSWDYFNNYLVKFFNDLTDNTINAIVQTANVGDPMVNNIVSGLAPLSALDSAVAKAVSAKMFVTLLAAALTNSFGPFYLVLLFIGMISFLKAVMTALWVYVMSLILKTLLFGLAPIFIPTILFSRTRHIFDGWISQLVNASLQPVLLFTFFIFFVKLLEGSIDNILHTPVCFSQMPSGWRGSGFDFSFWRFMEYKDGSWNVSSSDWKVTKPFPIDLISVLTFFTIAEIASRFNTVVIQISTQISKASTNLLSDGGPLHVAERALTVGLMKKGK